MAGPLQISIRLFPSFAGWSVGFPPNLCGALCRISDVIWCSATLKRLSRDGANYQAVVGWERREVAAGGDVNIEIVNASGSSDSVKPDGKVRLRSAPALRLLPLCAVQYRPLNVAFLAYYEGKPAADRTSAVALRQDNASRSTRYAKIRSSVACTTVSASR